MPYATPELRTRRIAAGIKPGALAGMVDCHPGSLSHIEHGRRSGSPELFARIARVLECDVAVLTATDAESDAA